MHVDICIVGTGVAGVSTAYRLAESGRSILLISDTPFAKGESSRATAQINIMHDDGWFEMEEIHGIEKVKLCAESYYASMKFFEDTIEKEKIDCSFEKVNSYVFIKNEEDRVEEIQKEFDTSIRAGIKYIEIVDTLPGLRKDVGPAICYSNEAQFHPLAFLGGVADALKKFPNVEIRTGFRVTDIEDKDGAVELTIANGMTIICQSAVLATNSPISCKLLPLEALQPYRSYAIAIPIEKGSIENAQYSDTEDPYHYTRVLTNNYPEFEVPSTHDILIVGGEDHRVGVTENAESHFSNLYTWAKEHFPITEKRLYEWSGQTIETFDGLPLIGNEPGGSKNVFMITGDSGTGMTHGTIGAMLIADLIMGKENPWKELYCPSRSRTKCLKRWLKGCMDTTMQYKDWVTDGEVDSTEEIPRGTGAIMRDGFKKIAIYKDDSGRVHKFSAVCPHSKGIVRWNPVEYSFDCPVDGSRFNTKGEKINGPATTDLIPEI